MDLPRILPLDNEERIRTLICDGLITRGITDQCLGLAKDQQRHTQVSAKIAASQLSPSPQLTAIQTSINRTVKVHINSYGAANFFNG